MSQEGRGFPQDGRAAPEDLFWPYLSGNPSEQPWQPSENPVHPPSFNQINLFFVELGFLTDPM